MIENDTIKLLRECDAGIRMGVSSITEVIDRVQAPSLRQSLKTCRDEHEKLQSKVNSLLQTYHDDGKAPNPIAQGMSWVKTNVMLAADQSDETIADLMTDGCNMGVKSLHRYLNQYSAADEESKEITKRLIGLEADLAQTMHQYL